MLDPEIAAILPLIHAKKTPWSEFPILALRRGLARSLKALDVEPVDLLEVRDLTIPGEHGAIPARLYRPDTTRELPVLICLHGGGWVTLDVDSFDGFCRLLAREGQCNVLSVEYRLAPEHKFPAAIEDALTVLDWAKANRSETGGDGRVGIGGDSAGGNLASVVSMLTRTEPARVPDLQLLIYPAVDLSEQRESYHAFASGHVLERQAMEFFIGHYLNHPDEKYDLRVSPLLQPDLSGLPPALIFTAGFDPLRDEGAHFAERLQAAGIPVHYRCFDTLVHGFLQMGKLGGPRLALQVIADAVAQAWNKK
ncbi:acetyl esterase [Fluviicoccus keumensis]|uniref:Acetyl esterase n=1 Tax=Fluviicoccus keumensis TaxID=1435465 RepID=A0A4Q7ZBH6_9GAMM|nr:alpha/beta hydrolase [Fluviicoccus keumensis]RZU47514.1 acetyl esterase [Fluviicoccus keumensis]